ncbi:PREDICTED: replication protein A 70 kDa DNA-binding subunit B-like [Ipomoea nil]|uniref:replication protein A 70 kDa DNA-binding subunit B-like n=1 Tax=Ipomoea nil TaxID=35883 RepID=UPI000901694F|nr:PREDICTED: replication protein A 70 kDa DNA-binding subunit B-like [Ipomoea nil]
MSGQGQFIVGANLHPQLTTKAIRLRCVRNYVVTERKGENNIRSQECVFHDQEGVFIHVHIPKDIVCKYKNEFKEGNVYGIRNFLCITNFFKYKTSTLRYMIKFKHDTIVKHYKRITFPKTLFRFKTFPAILSKQDVDEKVLMDVIGRIVEIYSPLEKVICGRKTRLIDFVLEDMRAKFMDNGEVRICSSFDATQLFFSHPCKEFVALKSSSFTADSTPLRCIDSSSMLGVGFPTGGGPSKQVVVSSIEEIYSKNMSVYSFGEYWVAGRIVGVESLCDWYYISCKTNSCKKKLSESGGMLYCAGCKNYWQEGVVRYRLIVRVADDTGDAPMLIWDRECAELVGMVAGDLKDSYLGDEAVLTQHCSGLLGCSQSEMVSTEIGGSLDVGKKLCL